jgi:hypothetical protein
VLDFDADRINIADTVAAVCVYVSMYFVDRFTFGFRRLNVGCATAASLRNETCVEMPSRRRQIIFVPLRLGHRQEPKASDPYFPFGLYGHASLLE